MQTPAAKMVWEMGEKGRCWLLVASNASASVFLRGLRWGGVQRTAAGRLSDDG